MFNWKKIQIDYPNAYKRFCEVMFPYIGVMGLSTLYLFDTRKLYYFFDKQKIFLTIERFGPNQWVYTISLSDGRVLCPYQESRNSRDEIESDGFIECFRIMEKSYHVEE
jgi:hypothetical protein